MKFDLPSKSMEDEFDGDGVPSKLLSRRGATCAVSKKKKKGKKMGPKFQLYIYKLLP